MSVNRVDTVAVPLVMTTDEAAAILRTSPQTVVGYIHGHELTAIQIGRERRIRGVDLIEFIETRQSARRAGSKSETGK